MLSRPDFIKRPALAGETRSKIWLLTTSSANSGAGRRLTGRPISVGSLQETATIWTICSAVKFGGAQLFGWSLNPLRIRPRISSSLISEETTIWFSVVRCLAISLTIFRVLSKGSIFGAV